MIYSGRTNYQLTAVLLVAVGLYLSTYLTVNLNKNLPGVFMVMGLTLVSAAGAVSDVLATTVIQSLIFGIIIATLCQALVYPFFPEDPLPPQAAPPKEQTKNAEQSNWIAICSTLIVLPAYLLVLINSAMYMPYCSGWGWGWGWGSGRLCGCFSGGCY